MKKLSLAALLSIMTIAMFGQSTHYSRSMVFKKLFLDYQSQKTGGSIVAFKDYKHGFEFGLSQKLTENLTFYVPGKFGVVKDSVDGTYRTLMGIDGVLQYHFYNKTGNFTPYFLVGAGYMKVYNGSNDVNVPVGLGLNIKVTDRLFFTLQSEYRISLNLKENNLHHGIGVTYMFGKRDSLKTAIVSSNSKDSDLDGVPDDLDLCPQVRGVAELYGCPDTDGDGVPDYKDACPDAKGLKELKGCPDVDGDGVADVDDECPTVAGSKFNKGCPDTQSFSDKDQDGVEDKVDKCPDQAGPASSMGCPDRDGDGVSDDKDNCPGQAGPVSANGCPDSDGDGTPDNKDKCPNSYGPKVYAGCPDTDGDGIDDFNDRCPNMPGSVENKGCPKISEKDKQTLDVAMRAVEFDLSKATLKPISYQILNQVAEILKKYPDYNVAISGHTDNTGSSVKNQELSEQRAKSCYDYLLKQGISALRMTYVGYGESRPIATNDNEAGRKLNRRVEFELIPAKK